MTTVITIVLYFVAAMSAALFGAGDKDEPIHLLFWAVAFVVFFVLASVLIWL